MPSGAEARRAVPFGHAGWCDLPGAAHRLPGACLRAVNEQPSERSSPRRVKQQVSSLSLTLSLSLPVPFFIFIFY